MRWKYKPYWISQSLPWMFYTRCENCGMEFIREKGWAVRYKTGGNLHYVFCAVCLPTREDVEAWLEVHGMPQPRPLPPFDSLTYGEKKARCPEWDGT